MIINKLSDVNPFKAFILPKKNLCDYVFESKKIEIDVLKKYDIALVLGCSNYKIMRHRADMAVALYKKRIVNKLFLTGGIGFLSINRHVSEASVMRDYILSQGISDDAITIEDCSKNTYENIRNSITQIEKICGKRGKIIIVTSDFHSKRSKGIAQKMTNCSIYSYGILDGMHDTYAHWSFSVERFIRTEAFLLSWYTRRGIIDDQVVVK